MLVEASPTKKDAVDICEYKRTYHLTLLTPVSVEDAMINGESHVLSLLSLLSLSLALAHKQYSDKSNMHNGFAMKSEGGEIMVKIYTTSQADRDKWFNDIKNAKADIAASRSRHEGTRMLLPHTW